MSYADQQSLSVDPAFLNRNWACLCTEAQGRGDDPTAAAVLADPWAMVQRFIPLIATAPGFSDKYAAGGQEAITDLDLLSAVQAAWPRVQVPTT